MHHRCIALEHATMRVLSTACMLHADGRGRSRKVHARSCRGRGTSCMPAGLAIFFFFFFFFGSADPRIFEDSNGSSVDPDRSGFRWIRFTPRFNAHLRLQGHRRQPIARSGKFVRHAFSRRVLDCAYAFSHLPRCTKIRLLETW